MSKESLMEFPCHFPVKIIGNNSSTFLEEIRAITLKHFPNTAMDAITYKESKDAHYLAITATVYAENQQMLDAYYQDITKHPEIKMVL